jgi:hypothetical protein
MEYFEGSAWDDIVAMVSETVTEYDSTLRDPSSPETEIRVAQGAIGMANFIIDLPKYVDEHYNRLQEESEDE